jgi:uncharacterized protein (DUF736 family)
MQAFEARPNTGVLFSVKAKKHPKAPDYTGNILIDVNSLKINNGQAEVRIAGWKKISKGGITFLSLSIDTYQPNEASTEATAPTTKEVDDDIF